MEWIKMSVAQLLESYKRESILYDTKSAMYYNKNARRKALNRIVDDLQDVRSGTTMQEVVKKISTLRTQFGQELARIKKSEALCGDNEDMRYTPSVWWYQELSFVKDYIRQRSNLFVKQEQCNKNEDEEQATYDEEQASEEYETIYKAPEAPSSSGNKSYRMKRRASAVPSPDAPLLEDATAYSIVPPKKVMNFENGAKMGAFEAKSPQQSINFEVIDVDQINTHKFSQARPPGRHEEIGRFVTSQMTQITDDILFYKTQHEILNVINKAIISQLEKNFASAASSK